MKNVLIVDDEKNLRESLQDGFPDRARDFKILTAENGAKATVLLSSMPIDLVVTDLKMPVMDGFELLAYMSKHYPRIPTIIMTAHSSMPDIAHKLKLFSSSRYLSKPIDLNELASMIITELEFASLEHLQALTLPDFLQLMATEERTGTLSVEFGEEKGSLSFKHGELLDAETGLLSGDDAVIHMAGWGHAKIDISPYCAKKVKNVHGSINELLIKRRRLKDEQESGGACRAEASEDIGNSIAAAPESRPVAIDAEMFLREIHREEHKGQHPTTGTAAKEGKMATTREILGELSKLESIEAVCLVARDGFLLESIARKGIDREMIGAIASSGFGASASMGKQLDKGTMQISMIEFERGPVMLAPIGEDAFLVIVADKEANLGMIRLKLKKHSGELALAAAI